MLVPDALSGLSGLETLKTLAGALDLPRFTYAELAAYTGVSSRTVATVCRRYKHVFERLDQDTSGRPGRPSVRLRLNPDHHAEVLATVSELRSSVDPVEGKADRTSPEAESGEAFLVVAASMLSKTTESDPSRTTLLVTSARHAIAAAGYAEGSIVQADHIDDKLATKAEFLRGVADLVEAVQYGAQEQIDSAQVKALSLVARAREQMLAEEWLPLTLQIMRAPSTVLGAPVQIRDDCESAAKHLLPALQRDWARNTRPNYVTMVDARARSTTPYRPVTSLFFSDSQSEVQKVLTDAIGHGTHIVVSRDPSVMRPVARQPHARFVLDGMKSTATAVAELLNRLTFGLD